MSFKFLSYEITSPSHATVEFELNDYTHRVQVQLDINKSYNKTQDVLREFHKQYDIKTMRKVVFEELEESTEGRGERSEITEESIEIEQDDLNIEDVDIDYFNDINSN